MNPMIENSNYWRDPRVIASMVKKPQIVEMRGGRFIVWVDDEDVEHHLLCKWEVCGTCRGNGKHVNPSIDASGLTAEDFHEDPDFAEMYVRGDYDVICNECDGLRVVPVLDVENNPKELVEKYHQYREDEYRWARESAAERAMGA